MSAIAQSKIIRFGEFEVDLARREIRRLGRRIRLQHKPFQILELLLRNPGALITREELARYLWPDSHVGFERCLNTAVNNLRHALGDSSHGARFIETRPGLGYVFIAKAEDCQAPARPHHDYLKGQYLLAKLTEEDTRKAVAYFESALTETALTETRAALAYSALADAQCEIARLSSPSLGAAALKARKFAHLALAADSHLAEAHLALARVKMLFDRDWQGARSEFLRALEINSGCAAAHRFYASLLMILNEHGVAFQHVQQAQLIEPLSLPIAVDLAWNFYLTSRYEAAVEQCWTVLALEPRYWGAQLALGLSYAQLGMPEEAVTELENAVACSANHPTALDALQAHSTNPIRIFFGCIAPAVLPDKRE